MSKKHSYVLYVTRYAKHMIPRFICAFFTHAQFFLHIMTHNDFYIWHCKTHILTLKTLTEHYSKTFASFV